MQSTAPTEPRINELEPQTDNRLDTMPIMSSVKKRPKRGALPTAFLSMSEIKSLMAAITRLRDRAIFSVAYHRGLRASEVGMLQMRDYTAPTINARTGGLYVRRLKDSDSKIYSPTRPEQKELRNWLRVRGDYEGPIFPSSRRRGIGRKMLDVLMKHYSKLAAIPKELRHFHALKHSCGVHLLLQGLGVDQVKEWLWHRNINNTMVYLRVANIRLDAAAEKLANW
jgi:site-specific recombinase XerD